MDCVFLHDQLIAADKAHIAVDDRGFLFGDGLFETLRVDEGRIGFFAQHVARLVDSATALAIPMPYTGAQLFIACQALLNAKGLSQGTAALRITLTRGRAHASGLTLTPAPPTLLITARSYAVATDYRPRACLTDIRRNPVSVLVQHKTLHYLEPTLARLQAQQQGFDEGILSNVAGCLTESSVANLFFVYPDRIVTPRVEEGVLPGIMRAAVLEMARRRGLAIILQSVTPEQALQADAVLQTNSLVGMQRLACIGTKVFAHDTTPLTDALFAAYHAALSADC